MGRWTIATLDATEYTDESRAEVRNQLEERLGEDSEILETLDGALAVFKRVRAVDALVDVFERADASGHLYVLTVNGTTEAGDVSVYELNDGVARSRETISGQEGSYGTDAAAEVGRQYAFLPVTNKAAFFD